MSAEDRAERRRLIARDSAGLAILVVITVLLGIGTYFFVGSYKRHRVVLAQRWQTIGERYLSTGKPVEAVDALHSALEYAPGDRKVEMDLAMALVAAGRDREAKAYFRSLLMAQPGNGEIYLQLARLSVRHGHAPEAIEDYQRALDGTWPGNGYLERLSVRLELAGYLIHLKDYVRAQSELRTASGNAPDDPTKQIEIAAMLERAQDPGGALSIYLAQMKHRDAPLAAFVDAGRTAYELGRISTARDALSRATEHREFAKQSAKARQSVLRMLGDADRMLVLYPDPNLSVGLRAERVRVAAVMARARAASCLAKQSGNGEMQSVSKQWKQLAHHLATWQLERNPQLEQTTMNLVYDTERQAASACGAPSGDDALLLKMSHNPQAVTQ